MAPKKNAFSVFVTQYKNEEIKKGNRPSFQELASKLTPVWNSMSENEKNEFKIIAKELNEKKVEAHVNNHVNLQNDTSDYWTMKEQLAQMFELIAGEKDLYNKKFILLHVNCHSFDAEQYYFPAEIAALEFTLLNGVSRTYHQIIGLSKMYPRGFAGGMREYSDKFHQICCWHQHPDDYERILMDFIKFLKPGIDNTDLQENIQDLPYMFTIETEVGLNMMKSKSSLERLYRTVFLDHDPKHKSVFKIGSVELLLFEIKNKLKLHLDQQCLRPGMSNHEILEANMFGHGLGCVYHEIKNIAFKCSKARILQWMSNICMYVNKHTGLPLTPGRHVAVQLRNGSRMIVENDNVPLSKCELNLLDKTKLESNNLSKNNSLSELSPSIQSDLSLNNEETN